jgi:hypothetical protein
MARAKRQKSADLHAAIGGLCMSVDLWARDCRADLFTTSPFCVGKRRATITSIRAWLIGAALLMMGMAGYATDSRTSPPGWNWGSQAFTGGGPEACNGSPTSVPTVCGPYIYSAAINAQTHAQMVMVVATVGMTSAGSYADNLCAPWGGTVDAITLEAGISSGAVISTQAGASEPPSYKTYVLWPMSLNFVLPAGQAAMIYLVGGANGSGCGTFTFTLTSM